MIAKKAPPVSPEEALKELLRLLSIEEKESLLQYEHEVLKTPLHERKQKGLTWHPVRVSHRDYGFGEQFFLSFERPQSSNASRFQVGERVALSEYNAGKRGESISGVAVAVWKDAIKIAFSISELPDWVEDADALGLDLLFDDASFREMKHALEFMGKATGRNKELRDVLLGERTVETEEVKHFVPIPTLNQSQNEAIRHVLEAKDVAIIHGPPGTGKTTTLVQAIKLTLQQEKQVLVCAPSNTAVDLLAERLSAKGISVVRIGNPARVGEESLRLTLEARIADHADFKMLKKIRKDVSAFRDMASKYKRNFGKDEREQRKLLFAEAKKLQEHAQKLEDGLVEEVIGRAQVIAATLVGAMNKYIKGRKFSTVFIDEAAQALEPACWVPISKSSRVVLAGDHCQLPPTVKSETAAREGLTKTLFEKSMAQLGIGVMLDTQYRMHNDIVGFSGREFYKGELKSHASVAQATLGNMQDDPFLSPLDFIDTVGTGFEEAPGDGGNSLQNKGEADLVLRHLEGLLAHLGMVCPEVLLHEDFSIGIISPYSAQVAYLKEQLQQNSWLPWLSKIKASTVDGFQGQEQEIIYISLVRSNDKGEIGFLKDTRRLNVALTRAKRKLIIIGDSATIGQHPFYERLLGYVEEKKAYKSAWEF